VVWRVAAAVAEMDEGVDNELDGRLVGSIHCVIDQSLVAYY
jgi:hypothetical protein